MGLAQIIPFYAILCVPFEHRLENILLLSLAYFILQLVLVKSHYVTTEVPLMLEMRRLHKFEFDKHARRMLVVFIATTLSLAIVLAFEVSVFYLYACSYGIFTRKSWQFAMYDPRISDDSICQVFSSYYLTLFGSQNRIGMVLWFVDFMILIPSLTFFAFDKPHDCFVCLGKDPERIFSRFQLTKSQVERRKFKAKLSTTLTQSIEKKSLIKTAESEGTLTMGRHQSLDSNHFLLTEKEIKRIYRGTETSFEYEGTSSTSSLSSSDGQIPSQSSHSALKADFAAEHQQAQSRVTEVIVSKPDQYECFIASGTVDVQTPKSKNSQ